MGVKNGELITSTSIDEDVESLKATIQRKWKQDYTFTSAPIEKSAADTKDNLTVLINELKTKIIIDSIDISQIKSGSIISEETLSFVREIESDINKGIGCVNCVIACLATCSYRCATSCSADSCSKGCTGCSGCSGPAWCSCGGTCSGCNDMCWSCSGNCYGGCSASCSTNCNVICITTCQHTCAIDCNTTSSKITYII